MVGEIAMSYDIITDETVLHQVSEAVDDIKSPQVQSICAKLENFVFNPDNGAAGLAAIQLGVPLRIFAIAVPERKGFSRRKVLVMINPSIASSSSETDGENEGCLSEPGKRVWVERLKNIHVHYTDPRGISHLEDYTGFLARVYQHELDHLDGILLMDYEV